MKDFAIKQGIMRFGIPASILTIIIKSILDCQGKFLLIKWTDFINVTSLIIIISYVFVGYGWGLCMWKLLRYKENKNINKKKG